MEFKIEKREFLKGLERTLSVVERRNTMPSLNHALFEVNDGNIQISATDLEIFITSTSKCQTLSEGRLAVPAKSVYDIVRECDDATPIHVRSLDNNRVEISSGQSHFKLLGLAADSFPHFKTSPKGQQTSGKVNVAEFVKLVQKTEHSVCLDEIRYFLTGIYFESVDKSLRAVATDGFRLALMDIGADALGNFEIKRGLIMPKKGAVELKKLLESTSEEEFSITCDENIFRASVGEFNLWIRPIDGEYPDYKRSIPKNHPSKLYVSKNDLAGALRRMSLLVSDRSRVVSFEFTKDAIKLSTNNPDLGEANDSIPCRYDGPSFKTGFNARYFIDAILNFDGDELTLSLGEKLQPVLLGCDENPGLLLLIMPMRI